MFGIFRFPPPPSSSCINASFLTSYLVVTVVGSDFNRRLDQHGRLSLAVSPPDLLIVNVQRVGSFLA